MSIILEVGIHILEMGTQTLEVGIHRWVFIYRKLRSIILEKVAFKIGNSADIAYKWHSFTSSFHSLEGFRAGSNLLILLEIVINAVSL